VSRVVNKANGRVSKRSYSFSSSCIWIHALSSSFLVRVVNKANGRVSKRPYSFSSSCIWIRAL